jgi:hypothetical protein
VTRSNPLRTLALAALMAAVGGTAAPQRAAAQTNPAPRAPTSDSVSTPAPADTAERLQFSPSPGDSGKPSGAEAEVREREREGAWLRAPLGEGLITDIEPWHAAEGHHQDLDFLLDYNRVDALRLGLGWRYHETAPWMPRVGLRWEEALDRNRTLYGAQFEQPVTHNGRFALGAIMLRRTEHSDQQQTGDLENSFALLMLRYDYRDYWERENVGAYASLRVPDFSTISLHVRSDQYRSLEERPKVISWAHGGRFLRDNPAIDDGVSRNLLLRLERPVRLTRRMRAGFYHWIEVERAGYGMGGDFKYTRALADLRSVVRLSPASTLSLRAVGGHTPDGDLPRQKAFALGGPDGLRAHVVGEFRGSRMALGQAEYDVGLRPIHSHGHDAGVHLLAFVDAGQAWNGTGWSWEAGQQKFAADGGFGVSTSENAMRIYLAKNLQNLDSDFVVYLRFQRPF